MDLMDVFKSIGLLFIRLCSISFKMGGFNVSLGSIFLFAGLVTAIIFFIRRLAE